jgi:hypothetical protein
VEQFATNNNDDGYDEGGNDDRIEGTVSSHRDAATGSKP